MRPALSNIGGLVGGFCGDWKRESFGDLAGLRGRALGGLGSGRKVGVNGRDERNVRVGVLSMEGALAADGRDGLGEGGG